MQAQSPNMNRDGQLTSDGTGEPNKPTKKRTRTRTGCLNCRRKKRRCDESRPACGTCSRRKEFCEWGLKITFRADNAQGIDDEHPSMKQSPSIKSPRKFKILDITSDVIRDYNDPSPVAGRDDDSTAHFSYHHEVDAVSSNTRREEAHENSSLVSPSASDVLSASVPRQNEIAVAKFMQLTQNTSAETSQMSSMLNRLPSDPIHVDVMDFSHIGQIDSFTPEGMSEDGIFQPGTAYHELHATLRNHLIQEVKSNAPTRRTTPRLDDKSRGGSEDSDSDLSDATSRLTQLPDSLPFKYGPSPLMTEEDECNLWKNWTDEVAPWLDKFDRHRHFQMIIPTMAHEHEHLRYSILALSARQIELKEITLPTDRSLALYQEAIHLLLPHLPSRSTATIASCVILCVLEMLSCSPKAWRRHLDGCASLMEAVGIDGFVGGTEQALFWCFARMDVCGGLISSIQTLIPVSHWASKNDLAADVELFRSNTEFEHWSNYAVYLMARVLQVLAPLPSETLHMPTRNDPKFRTRWLQLWECICGWHHSRPAPLLPIMTMTSSKSSPFPTILYSNPAAISGNQLHHTASILMLQNQPQAVKLACKPRSILWHARQVCGIGISNDHHGAWTNSVQPLWIAGRCMSHPTEHKAILELLEKIERESGWGTRWRADDLKEYWGDLGD